MSSDYLMYLSLSLFAASAYLHGKRKFSITTFLFYVLLFVSAILFLLYGISYYFTGNGIDESTIFHLRYGLGGAGFSEYLELIITSIVLTLLTSIFFIWTLSKRVPTNPHSISNTYIPYLLVLSSLVLNPAVSDLYDLLYFKPNTSNSNQFYTEPYSTRSKSNDFYDFYREPSITKVMDEPKNLVVIYGEGLERTFFDETIFPGLIKGLRELEAKSTYFTNIKQVVGTGWTIAGMVASQCGIPLFTPSDGNSMSGMDTFLPSAICLGDLLQDEGYKLAYYGGADLTFAGKGKFYSTHKFDDVCGREELLPILPDQSYKTAWGLYDDSLFDLAYKRFMQLSAQGDNFGIFLLTLDTHPNGNPSKSCHDRIYKDGSSSMLNAVSCSDYLIKEFVDKIMESPYGQKTVVVVISDHFAMRNSASNLLKKKDRTNLFMIIEANVEKSTEINALGSALDIGATILPFIGYKGDIGLGRDLTDRDQSTSDIEYIQMNLRSWKSSISQFWDFPQILDSFEIDVTEKILRIDDREFAIPVLVELNAELQTTLDHGSKGNKKLIDRLLVPGNSKPFILIDECANVNKLDEKLGQIGFCMVAGYGNNYIKKTRLYGKVRFTSDDIRDFTEIMPNFRPLRVAHAGGGIGRKTYTNSLEALDENIKKGFVYFELDFSFTRDGQLVCIHDWERSFERAFGFWPQERPTLETFESLVEDNSEFRICTLESLAHWMDNNPSAFIITDIKEDNLKGLKMISKSIPKYKTRIIPQIYDPRNYDKVKKMGYRQIIWTLYRYAGSNDDVLNWVDTFQGAFAITMSKNRAASDLPAKLAGKNIPTYVHTINNVEEMNQFVNTLGLTEIYTDFLPPKN